MRNIGTYRSEPEDSSLMYFDIAFLGYSSKLSADGLKQFAKDNEEQVEQFKRYANDSELYLKDGTRITAITYIERFLHGYKFDQLILFDDNRWLIESDKMDMINDIRTCTMYMSNVPEECQILKYEDIGEDIKEIENKISSSLGIPSKYFQ